MDLNSAYIVSSQNKLTLCKDIFWRYHNCVYVCLHLLIWWVQEKRLYARRGRLLLCITYLRESFRWWLGELGGFMYRAYKLKMFV